jgi:hypothetical protein
MLIQTENITLPETLNLAITGSAVRYVRLEQPATINSIGGVLNGASVNSGANVVISFAIDGGAVFATVPFSNGDAAGASVVNTIAPVVLPAGSVVSATVTTAATVAAGSASITLGLHVG